MEPSRHEYVVFSDSARKAGIPQYLDNRQIYGYITFGEGDGHHVEGGIEQARALLEADLRAHPGIEGQACNQPGILSCQRAARGRTNPLARRCRPKLSYFVCVLPGHQIFGTLVIADG